MGALLLIACFVLALAATRRGLGRGLVAVLAVGYLSGITRANVPDAYTTFMFDASVAGLYCGTIVGTHRLPPGTWAGPAGRFVLLLMAWPAFLTLVPVNHFLIQLVSLRAAVWFLPVVVIAGRASGEDLTALARGLAVLNLVALAVGIYLFVFGVESLYPRNQVTRIIYMSGDVAGGKFYRIPSVFLNAHAYGGTMLLTLPLLIDRLAGVGVPGRDRGLALAGAAAAGGGMLMCGARAPLITFVVTLGISWALSRFSPRIGIVGAVLVGGALLMAGTSERFQRGSSLGDTDLVAGRLNGSVNSSFLDLLSDYPMGAGMGTAEGTSIPFFLTDVAPEQIGMENEYSRILIDQGWIGLGSWVLFLVWFYARPPRHGPPAPWRLGLIMMYSLTLAGWATACIGTGALTSIPGTVLCLAQMGILAGARADGGSIHHPNAPPPQTPTETR